MITALAVSGEELTGTIDLAGVDRTITGGLTGDAVITNSSDTAATLTIGLDSGTAAFTGTIGGNIALVKTGDGTQTLAANTFTGVTTIQGGLISFATETAFGTAATVALQNGGVSFIGTTNTTLAKTYAITGTGTVAVASGLVLYVPPAKLGSNNFGKTLVKSGKGTLQMTGAVGVCGAVTRWIIQEGQFNHQGGDLFGTHAAATTNLTLDIREGATYYMTDWTHSPIGPLELTGGTFKCSATRKYADWADTAFKGGVTVHASAKTSVIQLGADSTGEAHLNHVATSTTFNVEEGAVLRVNGGLVDGRGSDANSTKLASTLYKTGAGELILGRPSSFTGSLQISGGTVTPLMEGALSTCPVAVNADATLKVPFGTGYAMAYALSGSGTLTKAGEGELLFSTVPTVAGLTVAAGTCAFPTLAGIPSGTTFATGSILGIGDFASNWQAALTAYPGIAGIANAAANAAVTAFTPAPALASLKVGTVKGTTLAIGTLSNVTAPVICGLGKTTIGTISGADTTAVSGETTAFLPEGTAISSLSEGVAYLGDSADATLARAVLHGANRYFDVPEGKILTVGSFALGDDGTGLYDIYKTGAGRLVLPAADNTGYFVNLYVQGGIVQAAAEKNLGSGFINVSNSGLAFTGSVTQSQTKRVTFSGTCVLDVGANVDFTINTNSFWMQNVTLYKRGAGRVIFNDNNGNAYGQMNGSHWIFESGTFYLGNNDVFGGHTSKTSVLLEFLEGTTFSTTGHLPLNNIILHGATVYARLFQGASGVINPLNIYDWKAYGLNGTVTVEPSTNGAPSVIRAYSTHVAHSVYATTFNVKEGAELDIDALVYPGRDNSGVDRANEGFVKTGKGTLKFLKSCNLDGAITLDGGTIELARDAHINPSAKISGSADAVIKLDDGALLATSVSAYDQLLASADIWMDAAALNCAAGASVGAVPNCGTAGGQFELFTTGTIPGAPTYVTGAINGRGALAFNGAQALVLKSYTNNTDKLTLYLVSKWTSWTANGGSGKWGGEFSLSYVGATGNDNAIAGTFHYENGGDVFNVVHNNYGAGGNYGTSGLDEAIGSPALARSTRNGTDATFWQYVGDSNAPKTGSATIGPAAFTINLAAIGGRLGSGGTAQYYGTSTANRMFIGQIGEFIVFNRVLSDTEKAAIESYLKRKWFASSVDAVSVGSSAPPAIEVPEGATATFTGTYGSADAAMGGAGIVKKGAGTLRFGATSTQANTLDVQTGTLNLTPGTLQTRADIWLDPSDASTLTLDGSTVTAIANKGRCGGSFTQNTRNSRIVPCPTYLASGINGLPVLVFDGNSVLASTCYTNKLERRTMHLYGVFLRTNWQNAGGSGKWAGPFSFTHLDANGDDQTHSNTFHIEEAESGNYAFYWGNNLCDTSLPIKYVTGTPYMMYIHQSDAGFASLIEQAADSSTAVPIASRTFAMTPLNVDITQIGGRIGPYGCAQYLGMNNGSNRLWFGQMGEFIVFTQPLNSADEAALLDYLRAKWLAKGSGSTTPPACLKGDAVTVSLNSGTDLTIGEGATLIDAAATQPLGSLTIGAGASLIRDWTSDPATYALFSVSGLLTLPPSVSLAITTAPAHSARLIGYGTLSGSADWTVSGDKASTTAVVDKADRSALYLSRSTGVEVILR